MNNECLIILGRSETIGLRCMATLKYYVDSITSFSVNIRSIKYDQVICIYITRLITHVKLLMSNSNKI